MTEEALTELNRKIAVMEASKTQEIEERRIPNCNEPLNRYPWIPDTRPLWNWLHKDYRVKPVSPAEPRRIRIFPGIVIHERDGEFIELTPEIRKALGL